MNQIGKRRTFPGGICAFTRTVGKRTWRGAYPVLDNPGVFVEKHPQVSGIYWLVRRGPRGQFQKAWMTGN